MTASTLTTLLDLVESELKDSGNLVWSTAELTQHIRRALRSIERQLPQRKVTELHTSAGVQEYSLSTLTDMIQVYSVWYPWYAADPDPVPGMPRWWTPYDKSLYLPDIEPAGDDTDNLRVFYTAQHTISGLDSASAGTLTPDLEDVLVLGAAAFAAQQASQSVINVVTASGWTQKQWLDWSNDLMKEFNEGLRKAVANQRALPDARVTWPD